MSVGRTRSAKPAAGGRCFTFGAVTARVRLSGGHAFLVLAQLAFEPLFLFVSNTSNLAPAHLLDTLSRAVSHVSSNSGVTAVRYHLNELLLVARPVLLIFFHSSHGAALSLSLYKLAERLLMRQKLTLTPAQSRMIVENGAAE